ncbi:ESX secretion-associated protein EspG [Saccharothrix sp.]|uniref:ESX secretion-associated protein EspG n=1 Tax=Saccharothrix sp. TaxID=1873460 RepID=UPI0028127FBF|nr:ESX secretion-associated protein EspG [Saccharothrix sp.]
MARRSGTAVVLSHLEFDLLWEDLGAGDPPYPLEVPSHGETMAERDALGAQVFRTLSEAGLADGDDVAPEVEDLFGYLTGSTLSVDALVFRPQPWRVLAAVRGARGVLAVLNDREVALEPITDLVPAVAKVVGDAQPGPGDQIRLPRTAFSAAVDAYATGGYAALERALAQAGITGRATRALTTLLESGRGAAGQLAGSGPGGRTPVLSWTDTTAGRYAMAAEDVAGEPWVRIAPADGAALVRHLTVLLDEVR